VRGATPAIGPASSGEPWFVGAYHYDRIVEQLGDVRIVNRPVPVSAFLDA
jgi:hypothetical protein